MKRFEEYITDPAIPQAVAIEDLPGFLESDHKPAEDERNETASIDDPVRVYLREMGSVRLLTRQGEIDLAQRMERGKLRMRKALSRVPLVWQNVLAMNEQVQT